MTQRQLLGNRFDDHDWIKISNIDFDGSRRAEDIKNLWQNSEHPSINQAEWSKEEVEKLFQIAGLKGCVDWEWIASELQTNRTAFMCLQKYQELNKELTKKEWTEEEDHMLIELVQKMRVGSFIPYTKIAYFMEGRNSTQLLYRWSKTLDPMVKRGKWTPAEDEMLLKAVEKYGIRDWFKIQEEVPGRVDAQCRGRFRNTLNQNVRRGKWSEKEVSDFKMLVEKHGVGKWAKISAELTGRTEMQCLHKWKVISGVKAKQWHQEKHRRKKRWKRIRRKKRKSSSESSEFSSEDVKLVESEEEEEGQEEEESPVKARQVEPKKRRVRCWNPVQSIVLDVDRWVPVVESKPVPARESDSRQGCDSVTVKMEGQNRPGRPKSSKIWRNLSCGDRALPKAREPEKKLIEVERALQDDGVPNPTVPDTTTHSAVSVPRKPPRARKEPKKAIRQIHTANLEKKLLVEMCRWTETKIVNQRGVDRVRERLEVTGLKSTSVFALLIQVYRIDKEGCMQIIKEKMDRNAQSLAEKEQCAAQLRQDACCLQQVKDDTVDVGNGHTMEVTRFKLGTAPPKAKPKSVLQLLAEKRNAKASVTTPESQSLAALAKLTTPPSSLPCPSGQGLPACKQTRPPSPVGIKLPRRRVKPVSHSSARPVARGRSVPVAPPVQRDTASNCRRLQPIAPMPSNILQPNRVVVPLMLPNSTVPVMAVLTPKGLLYVPPGSITALPPPITQDPAAASQATPCSTEQDNTLARSMVPSCSTQPAGTTVLAPAHGLAANSQADGCVFVPTQSPSGTKSEAMQPLTSPSPAIRLTPAPVPPAPLPVVTLTAGPPIPGHDQLPAATSVNSTVHLNQGGGASLSRWVPGIDSSSVNPSSLAQHGGADPPLTSSQPHKLPVDFKLLSNEPDALMKDWLQGQGGVRVPGTTIALPYLPPSSSTLRAFSKLLLHKKVLEQNLSEFGAPEETDPKKRLEAARTMVSGRLQSNPAYQLLKSRFLSTFVLPAFLATLPPRGTRTTVGPLSGVPEQDSEEESEYTDTDRESEDSIGDSRLHYFPDEGVVNEMVADEVADRELNQPFEISFTDLALGCNLPGSLETENQLSAPERPSAPKDETRVVTRWNLRPRKRR
ncbi:snRNA-activating protein complex subunit 4 isoform X3 [Scyliorhinus torazame]